MGEARAAHMKATPGSGPWRESPRGGWESLLIVKAETLSWGKMV